MFASFWNIVQEMKVSTRFFVIPKNPNTIIERKKLYRVSTSLVKVYIFITHLSD